MKRVIRVAGVLGVVLGSAAVSCSSSPAGGFAVMDQIFVKTQANITYVTLSNVKGSCNLIMSQEDPKGVVHEIIFVIPTLGPGKYEVVERKSAATPQGNQAWAQFASYRDGCKTAGGGFGSGTLELTRADDSRFAGSFELKWANGFIREDGSYGAGSMKGTFDAPECPAIGLPTYSLCN